MILNSPYISGSLTVTGNEVVTGSLTVLGGITGVITGSATSASYAVNAELLDGLDSTVFVQTGSFNTFSSSILTYTGSANTRLNSLEATTGSLNTASGSAITRLGSLETASGSAITRLNALEATTGSLNTASGSAITRLGSIESNTGSYATTGSNTFVSTQYISCTSNPTGFTTVASLYTDGGLRVTKDAYVSGTLYLNNVTVYGTQSVNYITSSQLDISDNIINVNTATPNVRFGGLAVYDSGSTSLTGSMLWDSQNNNWVYSNPSGSGNYDSAMVIMGPRNSGSLGNEQSLNCNYLVQGHGSHHTTSSMIYHDGTNTCIPNTLAGGISCFSTSCAASFIGGTMSGTTIYGSTAVCSPVGKFTTCLDLGGALTGTSATFSGNLEVFSGSAGVTVGDFLVNPTTKYVYVGRQSSTSGDNTTFVVRDRTGSARATIPGGGSIDTVFSTNNSNFIVSNYSGNSLMTIANTGAASFACSVNLGAIANSGDTSLLNIKQSSTAYNNGIYLERGGERNGYFMYIGGALDALTFRRNYFGTQSDVMSLTRDGNVGIGACSPLQTSANRTVLTINGTSSAISNFGISGTLSGYIYADASSFGFYSQGDIYIDAAGSKSIILNTNSSERLRVTSEGYLGTTVTGTTVTEGDLLGLLSFVSRDASTYSSGGITNIRSYATSTYNTGNVAGDLRFYVSNGLQNTTGTYLFGTEAMRITSVGSVGIGTLGPRQNLDVFGAIRSNTPTSEGAAIAFAYPRTLYKVLVSSNYDGGNAVRAGEWNVLTNNEGTGVTNTTQIYNYNSQSATFSISGGNLIISCLSAGNNQAAVFTN